jgi:nitroimidazol reductase NimA-like FMN-containing flavoprotein (pyridoxamine 5'-phosphate oxidase superfamily)
VTTDEYAVSMEALDEATCLRLLARSRVGRVGTVIAGDPVVLPVNCAVTTTAAGRVVVVRTAAGSLLDVAADGRVVAFETDHVDVTAESGWSVLVRGPFERVDDPTTLDHVDELDVHPWAPGRGDRWLRIGVVAVSGRLISRHRIVRAGEHVPYMPPD